MAMTVVEKVTAWLEANWDPDLTVREWWERLGGSGWAAPTWPVEWYGKGLARAEAVEVSRAIHDFGALGPPGGLGLLLAGPTIIAHGTDEQRRRYVHDIVTGKSGWSTARRCGRRRASTPTSGCCWRGPTPTCPSTRGSATSRSTCASLASTC